MCMITGSSTPQDAQVRKDVCESILAADIERAIALIDQAAPTMLLKQPGLNFKLRCQQFMELVALFPTLCRCKIYVMRNMQIGGTVWRGKSENAMPLSAKLKYLASSPRQSLCCLLERPICCQS